MDNVHIPESVSRIYREYLAEVAYLMEKRNFLGEIFGFGNTLKNNPCHERFAQALKQQLEQMEAETHPADEITAVMVYIYTASLNMECHDSARWMLEAVHALTLPMIDKLPREQAVILLEKYEEIYPLLRRLPVQVQVRTQLRIRAEGGIRKRK